MRQYEYRLYYHVRGEVMESVRYTMAEDSDHAIINFKRIVPPNDQTLWINLEMFCPYRNDWLIMEWYDAPTTISQWVNSNH